MQRRTAMMALALSLTVTIGAEAEPLPYDIVYVRQPRFGDNTNTTWPEVFHPAAIDPGADLVLLHPDGSEEVLVTGGNGAVTDPFVSLDGRVVYYSLFPDVRQQAINYQRGLPYAGADIYRIHLASRQIQRLTFGEFTPNTGAARWYRDAAGNYQPVSVPNPYTYDHLGYGILNLGAAPLAGGKIAFTSNRNGFQPPKGFTNPTMQLFVMDEDGGNVTPIAPMTISSALHPTPLVDGRLMFSTHESQGLRDARLWGIWSIFPDGRYWSPVVSAFHDAQAFHFMTQLSNTDLVVVDYYNLNNNGFGALFRLPVHPPSGEPRFHGAFPQDNPPIAQTVGQGYLYPFKMAFTPRGFHALTPFTHPGDEAAPIGSGNTRVGKLTHPSAAPDNDLLVVWSPGPANDLNRPTTIPYYDGGLYLMRNGDIASSPADLVLIKNDPAYNEAWPRAVVSYRAIYGVDAPAELPWLPNDGSEHPELPAGTPYGLVGASSLYKRESFPGFVPSWSNTFDGLDAFNTAENGQSSNWVTQGSDAGLYDDSEIWAVRLLAMEPGTHRSYGPTGGPSGNQNFYSHAMERLRILGEIPVRKFRGAEAVLDPEGNPDTSFLAKIPADTPFTFQLVDRNGMNLTMAQTWHQLRPGEVRHDCGGCHAHSQQPLEFSSTYAGRPGYEVTDLTASTPLLSKDGFGNPTLRAVSAHPGTTVEFLRDIRPILQRSCVPCHTTSNPTPPGALVLDDYATYDFGIPGDFTRLAYDSGARWGHKPVIASQTWRQTNTSRYIRAFQSRRSLLVWKIFGARLDGWTNARHPTESTPGNAATLPPGASANAADVDYTGTMMPPPGSGVPELSEDEKMMIVRWIDLGCPIDYRGSPYGWLLDDLRPVLDVSLPRPGDNESPMSGFRIGFADADSGIDGESLSITADITVEGRAPGEPLADLVTQSGDGIYTLALSSPLSFVPVANLDVSVADRQGNVTRVQRRFSVGAAAGSTPTVAATSLPTRTVTPAALHDSSVIGPRAARRIVLPAGTARRLSHLRVWIRNNDPRPDSHEIRLVAEDGTCPPGTVAGLPYLGRRAAAPGDRLTLGGQRRRAARIPLAIEVPRFESSTGAPHFCHLRIVAIGPGSDPTPANNLIEVELRVTDHNDL